MSGKKKKKETVSAGYFKDLNLWCLYYISPGVKLKNVSIGGFIALWGIIFYVIQKSNNKFVRKEKLSL